MENFMQVTLNEYMSEIYQKQTVGASVSPVRTSVSQESNSDLQGVVQASFSELCTFLGSSKKRKNPNGCSSRMLKIFLALMEDGTLPDFSLNWRGGGYDAEWQVLNSKYFGVPQNRERCFIIGHLGNRSTAKVFPVEGTNGTNNIHGVGHRKGYRRNMQIFSPEGITEALDTAAGGGRGHHTIEVIGKAYERDDYGDNRNRILGVGGVSPSLTATQYKEPYRIGLSLSEILTLRERG